MIPTNHPSTPYHLLILTHLALSTPLVPSRTDRCATGWLTERAAVSRVATALDVVRLLSRRRGAGAPCTPNCSILSHASIISRTGIPPTKPRGRHQPKVVSISGVTLLPLTHSRRVCPEPLGCARAQRGHRVVKAVLLQAPPSPLPSPSVPPCISGGARLVRQARRRPQREWAHRARRLAKRDARRAPHAVVPAPARRAQLGPAAHGWRGFRRRHRT